MYFTYNYEKSILFIIMSKDNKGMNEKEDPAKQFLTTIRIYYENKFGNISNEKFANEINITKGIFDRYMYRDSPIFDSLKGSALEKIVRNIFDKISAGTSWIDETVIIDILSKYIEDEKNYIQENNLKRTPIDNQILELINRKYKEEDTCYSTLDFIKDLLYELNIHHYELSIFFGKDERYLDDIKQRIRKQNHQKSNPNFKFSLENLKILENNLINKYGEQACAAIYFIEQYRTMNEDLKEYSGQQYHFHHPNLNGHYFQIIDTKEKAYWLGFLCADGYISKTRYGRLGIGLSVKDKIHLIKFCKAIGMEPSNVKEKDEILNYKGKLVKYRIVYIDFWCKPMYEELIEQDFKSFPKLISYDLYLSWLLGLYDGDGFQGKTMVCSEHKEILEQIKTSFNIKYEVREYYFNGESYIRNYGDITEIVDYNTKVNSSLRFLYILTLGARLFNKLMRNFNNSLERKRNTFSELNESLEKLIEEVVSEDILQELINNNQKNELIEKLSTTEYALDKLIDDWNLKRDWNVK
ncbi:hypothetical protein LCGC14_1250550 [marine sediment metagenome]|uniref:Homing endonuclease LAGLIDADG domain-containing protein n=1 Tax=marine sediment metagenome TaxID=412755 RepID=A0A0F9LPX0_9ZZZZ